MKKLHIFLLTTLILFSSCKKEFLETGPTNQVDTSVAATNLDAVNAILNGVYRRMRAFNSRHDQFGNGAINLMSDIMGEDMPINRSHWFGADYQFVYTQQENYSRNIYLWGYHYILINNANLALQAIDQIAVGDSEIGYKNSLKGQALSIRAYAYFRLARLFQDTYFGNESAPGVPIYTEPTSEGGPRGTLTQTYAQITSDLDQALVLLADASPNEHISQIDFNVANGLYARVALVMHNWSKAISTAQAARAGYNIMNPEDYSGFDDVNKQNWIWGLEVNDEQSTIYASMVSHLDYTVGGYSGLGYSIKKFSLALYNQMADGDIRKELVHSNNMVNYKFNAGANKGFSADIVMMRPEEMILIEAEAQARSGSGDAAAQALLTQLRNKRYATPTTVTATGTELLDQILLERRIELWGEGFRFFDIKRLNLPVDRRNSNHLSSLNPEGLLIPAGDIRLLFLIPLDEINSNKSMTAADQNPR